jgi:hypothetical protein
VHPQANLVLVGPRVRCRAVEERCQQGEQLALLADIKGRDRCPDDLATRIVETLTLLHAPNLGT